MPPDTPARTILDFDPMLHGGKHPRGCPPTRWKDTTGAFLVTANIQEDVQILARDRSKWRHHVASLSTPEAFRQEKLSESKSMSGKTILLTKTIQNRNKMFLETREIPIFSIVCGKSLMIK